MRLFGLARAGLGLAALLVPGPAARLCATHPHAIRFIGARDAAMGLALAWNPAPPWLLACLAVDGCDALIVAHSRPRLGRTKSALLLGAVFSSLCAGGYLMVTSRTPKGALRSPRL